MEQDPHLKYLGRVGGLNIRRLNDTDIRNKNFDHLFKENRRWFKTYYVKDIVREQQEK